jgi:hypothetical protein
MGSWQARNSSGRRRYSAICLLVWGNALLFTDKRQDAFDGTGRIVVFGLNHNNFAGAGQRQRRGNGI